MRLLSKLSCFTSADVNGLSGYGGGGRHSAGTRAGGIKLAQGTIGLVKWWR